MHNPTLTQNISVVLPKFFRPRTVGHKLKVEGISFSETFQRLIIKPLESHGYVSHSKEYTMYVTNRPKVCDTEIFQDLRKDTVYSSSDDIFANVEFFHTLLSLPKDDWFRSLPPDFPKSKVTILLGLISSEDEEDWIPFIQKDDQGNIKADARKWGGRYPQGTYGIL